MTNDSTYIALKAVPGNPPQTFSGGPAATERYQNRPLKQLINRSEAAAAVA